MTAWSDSEENGMYEAGTPFYSTMLIRSFLGFGVIQHLENILDSLPLSHVIVFSATMEDVPMSTAAIAAAAAAAQMRKEEEEMTQYSPQDLVDGWEFKFLRANTRAFKDPEVFAKVCEEEKEAGWILLEKFDDTRIRFKRPIEAKKSDHQLTIDPYRTVYGITSGKLVTVIIVSTIVGMAALGGLIALIINMGR